MTSEKTNFHSSSRTSGRIHPRSGHFSLCLLVVIALVSCASCKRGFPNPSKKIEQLFVEKHFSKDSVNTFTFSAMGADDAMNPKTIQYSLFLEIESEQFNRPDLDQQSDTLAQYIMREIMPGHHIGSQLHELHISVDAPLVAFDSTQYLRYYRKIHFRNDYYFSNAHIDSLSRAKTDTTVFDKIIH